VTHPLSERGPCCPSAGRARVPVAGTRKPLPEPSTETRLSLRRHAEVAARGRGRRKPRVYGRERSEQPAQGSVALSAPSGPCREPSELREVQISRDRFVERQEQDRSAPDQQPRAGGPAPAVSRERHVGLHTLVDEASGVRTDAGAAAGRDGGRAGLLLDVATDPPTAGLRTTDPPHAGQERADRNSGVRRGRRRTGA
jgi:hypothetical protein